MTDFNASVDFNSPHILFSQGILGMQPKMWLKADAISGLSDGDQITTWADQSGNGNDATGAGATKPLYKVSQTAAGGPAVRFQGTGYFTLTSFMSAYTAGEIFVVIKSDGGNVSHWAFGSDANNNDESHYPYGGVIYESFGKATNDRSSFTPGVSITDWRRYNVSSASGDFEARLDNASGVTDASNTVTWTSNPRIGMGRKNSADDIAFAGYIAEVIFFDRKLSANERIKVHNYLERHFASTMPAELAFYAQPPAVQATAGNQTFTTGSATLVFTARAPSLPGLSVPWIPADDNTDGNVWNQPLVANQTFVTGSATLDFSATAPTLTVSGLTVVAGTADLTFSAQAPTVTVGAVAAAVGSADLTFNAQVPTVTTGNVTFTTGTADLTFSAQAPTVFGSAVSVTTGSATLVFSAQAPTVPVGTTFTTGTADLSFSAQAPTVTMGAATVQTGSAVLDLSAQATTLVAGATSVTTGSADLSLNAQAPTLDSPLAFGTQSAPLVFVAQGTTVNNVSPLITGTASFRFIALAPELDNYESVLTAGSAVIVLTAGAPAAADVTIPVMDGEAPTGQSRQGDSTYETYKRRTFNP